jgi:hypothetical protein
MPESYSAILQFMQSEAPYTGGSSATAKSSGVGMDSPFAGPSSRSRANSKTRAKIPPGNASGPYTLAYARSRN